MARLERLREEIQAVDAELIRLLSHRFRIVRALAREKRARRVPVEDPERERALCAFYERICVREGFDAERAKRIFHAIFRESKLLQYGADKTGTEG